MAYKKTKVEEIDEIKLSEIEVAVAEVETKHKASADKREEDGVVETAEETAIRERSEELELRVARKEVTTQEQKHIDGRNARVLAVKSAIEAARLKRVEQEKLGIAETEGARIDREAKEAKDLECASKIKVVEDFNVENLGNPDVNTVVAKLKEIIEVLNNGYQSISKSTNK